MAGSVPVGKGTTCETKTPAPAGPSSRANALLPTNEMVTKMGVKFVVCAQAIRVATGW